MLLRKRVFVTNVRILNAVQQHVHTADAQHRRIEVETIEEFFIEMMTQLVVGENLLMMLSKVLAGRD